MDIAYVTLTCAAVLANAGIAAADLAKAPFVLANSAEVGVARSWIPALAALKAAGAAGLLLGLLGVRPLGVAAGAGLVLFYVGALAVHVRARVLHNIAFPGLFLALAVGALVLAAAR
ncbi:DoxX family protein [Streptomyces broussonetiae]|uniref:DoxX family protein n=1 Tax=Streptomyces broussonetiae TaxID=2686304 RepID=A0A6I6N1M7_9ACTN|nr:DoxX family protein [Streptomyces broussonetiae]QHA02745.1 DoxX family protein [Streptomyces broussonetiae]